MAIHGPVKVGIIGTGKMAEVYYLPKYAKREDVKIVALSKRKAEKAFKLAEIYRVENLYTGDKGWKKLVDRHDIDAITICTPNYLHAKIAIAGAKSGKHILVEKPMAVSLREADDMIQSAKENNVILMVSFPERFMPAYEEAKKIIDKRILGKINVITSVFGHPGPESWSPSGSWFFEKRKAGGGALLDLGSHKADFMCWLTGKRIEEVCAFAGKLEKNIKVEDNAICLVKFEDGAMGSFYTSWSIKPNPEDVSFIYCEKGVIKVSNNSATPIKVSMKPPPITQFSYGSMTSPEGRPPRAIAYEKLIEHFVRSIRMGEKPTITGKDGRRSLEIISAAYESMKSKKVVRLQDSY